MSTGVTHSKDRGNRESRTQRAHPLCQEASRQARTQGSTKNRVHRRPPMLMGPAEYVPQPSSLPRPDLPNEGAEPGGPIVTSKVTGGS